MRLPDFGPSPTVGKKIARTLVRRTCGGQEEKDSSEEGRQEKGDQKEGSQEGSQEKEEGSQEEDRQEEEEGYQEEAGHGVGRQTPDRLC
jgi:hypothetical protein